MTVIFLLKVWWLFLKHLNHRWRNEKNIIVASCFVEVPSFGGENWNVRKVFYNNEFMVTFSLEINYTIKNHKANSINEKEKKSYFICWRNYREISFFQYTKKAAIPQFKGIAAFILKLLVKSCIGENSSWLLNY
jgi:hypothetical protein